MRALGTGSEPGVTSAAQEVHEIHDLGLALRRQGFKLLDETLCITGVHSDSLLNYLGNKGADGAQWRVESWQQFFEVLVHQQLVPSSRRAQG